MEGKFVLIEAVERDISIPMRFETLEEAQREMAVRFAQAMDIEVDLQGDILDQAEAAVEDEDGYDVCISSMQAYCERFGQNFDWKIFPLDDYRKLSFTEATEVLKDMNTRINPSNISVYFSYCNAMDELTQHDCIPLPALYMDWYKERNLCPSNDTKIASVRFYIDGGKEIAVDGSIEFGTFMDKMESIFDLHKYRK